MIKDEKRFKIVLSIVMAMQAVLAIVFLVYAFYEKSRAEELEKNLQQLRSELQNCQKGVEIVVGD